MQIRATKDPTPSVDGIQQYIDFYGARLLQIAGFVKGLTEADLYTKITSLTNAFDTKNLQAEGNYGYQALQWTDPGQNIARYYVKPITNTLIVEETRTGLSRRFSVMMEAKDPVKYSSSVTTYTINPGTGAGSSSLPKATPFAISNSSYYGQTTISNGGASAVFPTSIVLTGPTSGTWTGPKVTDITSGSFLSFISTVTLAASEYITITPGTGQAIKTGATGTTTDLSASTVAGSSFFSVASGSSTIRIEGSTLPLSSSANITITSSF